MNPKTERMAISGVLIALHLVLCYVAVPAGPITITFAGLPVLIGALLMGPVSGLCIGLLGSLMNQLFSYGLAPTTPLWVLPTALYGLLAGLYAKRKGYALSRGQLMGIILFCSLMVTVLNSGVIALDAMIYHYKAAVMQLILWRLASSAIRAVLYVVVIDLLFGRLRRAVDLTKIRE